MDLILAILPEPIRLRRAGLRQKRTSERPTGSKSAKEEPNRSSGRDVDGSSGLDEQGDVRARQEVAGADQHRELSARAEERSRKAVVRTNHGARPRSAVLDEQLGLRPGTGRQ